MPQTPSARPIGADVSDLMPPVGADVTSLMTGEKPPPVPVEHQGWVGPAMEFGAGVLSQVNPVEILKGIYGAVTSPIETAKGIGSAQLEQFKKGKELYDQGRYSEALGHTLAGALPLVGPAAANIGEDIAAGNVAHGLGATTGLVGTILAPGAVKSGVKAARATGAAETVAGMAERGVTPRMVDVIAPKVGANKVRFGNMAKDVAPRLASEPEMGALSRRGLSEKVGAKLSEAEASLDAANDARNPAELVDTSLVTSGLEERLRNLMAQPAEGPEAHAAAARAGFKPPLPTESPLGQKFSELPPVYRGEVKRLLAEMEEFPMVERTWLDRSKEVAHEGGYGSGRGARNRTSTTISQQEKPFVDGAAGTPIYHEILEGKTGTTRNAMIQAMRRYVNEDRLPTSLVQRVINVADKRIRTPDAVSKPMLPLEDFVPVESGPLGESVIPEPNQPRAQALVQALKEVRALGPMAPYDSIKKIRQAWDQPARQRYVPSLTQDFLKKSGESQGAADVTGVLREVMSFHDPVTAAANKEYSFWRKADDVMKAADEVERVRPTVGRKIMSRFGGAMAGGAMGSTLGEVIGFMLGPTVDSMVSGVSEGRKLVTARALSDVANALRSGDVGRIEVALKKARAIGVMANASAGAKQ